MGVCRRAGGVGPLIPIDVSSNPGWNSVSSQPQNLSMLGDYPGAIWQLCENMECHWDENWHSSAAVEGVLL